MCKVIVVFAFKVHMHLLQRRHVNRDRLSEYRLVALTPFGHGRDLHLVPYAVFPLAVCNLKPIPVRPCEFVKHLF